MDLGHLERFRRGNPGIFPRESPHDYPIMVEDGSWWLIMNIP